MVLEQQQEIILQDDDHHVSIRHIKGSQQYYVSQAGREISFLCLEDARHFADLMIQTVQEKSKRTGFLPKFS